MSYLAQIDTMEQMPPGYTLEQLQLEYLTGKSIITKGRNGEREHKYRNGIQTCIGDIEESLWYDLISKIAQERGEADVLEQLYVKRLNECYISKEKQRKEFAMRRAYNDYAAGRLYAQDENNRCYYCDTIIPEGRQICPLCYNKHKGE